MEAVLHAGAVTKLYGSGERAVRALNGIQFQASRGEFVAIMGPSGCGKSTLLAVLGGLESPTSGEVWLGGQKLSGLREADLARTRRRKIGFVFQSFHLVQVLTAAENVGLPLLLEGQRGPQVEQRVGVVLGQVGLSDRGSHRPAELSGGQQQRVAIARALVSNPEIILADEPTGNLDSRNTREVLRVLRTAVDQLNQTVVMISHDPAVAAWADRVEFMRDGALVGRWRPSTDSRDNRQRRIAEIVHSYQEWVGEEGDSE